MMSRVTHALVYIRKLQKPQDFGDVTMAVGSDACLVRVRVLISKITWPILLVQF